MCDAYMSHMTEVAALKTLENTISCGCLLFINYILSFLMINVVFLGRQHYLHIVVLDLR